MYCEKLQSVSIGSKVISIQKDAFRGCERLSNVIFKSPNGWRVSKNSLAIDATDISNDTLSNTSLAATYLSWNNYYCNYYWTKNNEPI